MRAVQSLHTVVGWHPTERHCLRSIRFPACLLKAGEAQKFQILTRELLGVHCEWFGKRIPRTAIAILWLALHQQEVDPMLATNLLEAAELIGRQRWALILLVVQDCDGSHMK